MNKLDLILIRSINQTISQSQAININKKIKQ